MKKRRRRRRGGGGGKEEETEQIYSSSNDCKVVKNREKLGRLRNGDDFDNTDTVLRFCHFVAMKHLQHWTLGVCVVASPFRSMSGTRWTI